MPKQVFNSVTPPPPNVSCQSLVYGQLGQIIEDNHRGDIITKTYDGFVMVYTTNSRRKAFLTTWNSKPDFLVRILSPDENVVLSNG